MAELVFVLSNLHHISQTRQAHISSLGSVATSWLKGVKTLVRSKLSQDLLQLCWEHTLCQRVLLFMSDIL